jgi:hypothetical protein
MTRPIEVVGVFDQTDDAYEYCACNSTQEKRCVAIPAQASVVDGRVVITSDQVLFPAPDGVLRPKLSVERPGHRTLGTLKRKAAQAPRQRKAGAA